MDDKELERLLMQLLRVVNPAPAGEPPASARAADSSVDDIRAAPGHHAADAGDHAGNHGQSPENGGGGQAGSGAAVDVPTVSPSEARALIELVSARGIAQGELAGLLGLEKSTVSRLAAGLERKGWIRRGRDEGNQRYVRLYLTQEGRAVATQVWSAWQSRQARILSALSPEERVGLSAGLRGLVRGLAAEGLLGETSPPSQGRNEKSGPGPAPDGPPDHQASQESSPE